MSGTGEVFWTSDIHFFHDKIQAFCPNTRAGDTIEEMNELIIEKWNKTVRKRDRIFHLGDFSFGSYDQTLAVLKRLNGAKEFIEGNHDTHALRSVIKKNPNLVQSYKSYDEVKVAKEKFVLFHFPIECWNGMHHGRIHIHGHCHGQTSHNSKLMYNRIDVGIDTRLNGDMLPYHHSEMLELVKKQNDLLDFIKDNNFKEKYDDTSNCNK